MRTVRILLVLMLLAVVGCTHNQTELDADGDIRQITSSGNTSRIGVDGTQQAANLGVGPALAKIDNTGIWTNMPGPVGLLAVNSKTGDWYMASPKNVIMTGVEFTPQPEPGQAAFKAATLSMNLSEPVKEQVAAYVQAALSLEGMTKTEAEARVEQMRIAREITADIAEMLIRLFIPTLPDVIPE